MDRRRFFRIVFPEEAILVRRGRKVPATLKDIAYGGAYLICEEFPDIGEEVEIKFYLSGMEPPPEIRFLAEVVRHGEEGFGVKLKMIDLESLTHLRRLLYFNLPDADQAERELQDLLGEATLRF